MSEQDKGLDKKEVTIIVNTRPKIWEKGKITYQEVITLTFGSYSDDGNITYTVTYTKGPKSHHQGSMVKGDSVEVVDGMIFNVTQTNKS